MNLLKKNKDISNLSNFRTKALCEYYFEINSEDDLVKLFDVTKFATENDLKLLFVGAGTNMLFAFDKFEGIIIKNNLTGWNYDESSRVLKSYSNELISEIAEDLEKEFKQDLWHRFIGLPGSIGGAIYGNAGCFGLETESNFVEAEILDLENGQVSTMSKIDMNFSYRTSILKEKNNKYFLIKSKFDLSEKIEKYHSDVDNIYFRENKQPKGLNCGSFFKNPNKDQSGGYLIEQVGLKGYKIGGAYFSEKHANFLMNDGTGTYKNLLDLIELAQTKIKNEFGIDLINEVRIIKN